MAHTSAEAGTATGADLEGALLTVSSMSSLPLERIAAASATPKWFHFYMPADRGAARELLGRARAAGYRAIVFAVDTAAGFYRERNIRNNFSPMHFPLGNYSKPIKMRNTLGWDDVEFVQRESGLPVLLKGVLSESVARQAARNGLAGIQISNHGGRALDDSPATLTVLPRLTDAAGGKMLIVMDGGVRRGQDVFKALALGADAVGIGRPALYGLALGGASGVRAVLAQLKQELWQTMHACAVDTVADITSEYLQPRRSDDG